MLEKDNKQWPLLITDAGITFSVASRAEGVSASESSSDKQEDSRKTLSGPDWLTEMMKPNDCMSIASAAPKTEQQRRRIWKVNASATTNATTSLLLKELDSTSSEYLITDNGSCTPNRYQRSDSETPVRKPMIDQAVKSSKGRKFDPSADVFNLDKSLETKKPSSSSPSTAQSISTVIQSTKMKLIRDPIASSNQSKSPRDEKVQICSKSWFQDLDVNPVAVQDFTSPKKIFISNSKSSTPVSERKRIVSKTPTPSKSDNVIDERKGIEVSNYKEAIPSFLLKQETIKRYGKTSSRKQGDSLILLPTFRSPSPGKMSHKLHADSLDFTRESLQSLKQAAITSLVSVGDTIKLSTEQSSSTVLDQSTSWNSRRRFSTFRTMNKPVTDITTDTSSISSSRKYIPNDEFVFQDVDDL